MKKIAVFVVIVSLSVFLYAEDTESVETSVKSDSDKAENVSRVKNTRSDHLKPEDSLFSGVFLHKYTEMVLDAFSEVYAENVEVRTIVLPSFKPEYAVGIRKEKDVYSIFHFEPKKQYWLYIIW